MRELLLKVAAVAVCWQPVRAALLPRFLAGRRAPLPAGWDFRAREKARAHAPELALQMNELREEQILLACCMALRFFSPHPIAQVIVEASVEPSCSFFHRSLKRFESILIPLSVSQALTARYCSGELAVSGYIRRKNCGELPGLGHDCPLAARLAWLDIGLDR
jgi:hypothetical protein